MKMIEPIHRLWLRASRWIQPLPIKPMPNKETFVPFPPDWGDDSLSEYMGFAISNAHTTFANKKLEYERLACIDQNFLSIRNNLTNSKDESARIFMIRAHSGYRVACQLVMSGQIAESFPVMRVCIEYSLYALHIRKQPHTLNIWINRDKDDASKEAMVREFTIKNVRSTLEAEDLKLSTIVHTLYERSIGFGGHPNPLAVGSSIISTEADEERKYEVKYLHDDDSRALDHGIKTTAQIGLASLCIFRNIFPEHFEILGINSAITKLRQKL